MWMWDNSLIDCERRAAFVSGPKEGAYGEIDGSCGADDCSPDDVLEMYHYTNGTFLELNGFLEEAISEFRETVSICPTEGFYRYTLGVALLKNGQYNDAYNELTEALKLDPDNIEARCALADVHGEIGLNLEMDGRIEAAADEFREAVSMDSEYPDYCVSLGRVLLKICRNPTVESSTTRSAYFAEAIRYLRLALRLDPDCMEARLNLGRALTMDDSGRSLDEGITMLSSVLQTDPFNDDVRSCLDHARAIKGRVVNCS